MRINLFYIGQIGLTAQTKPEFNAATIQRGIQKCVNQMTMYEAESGENYSMEFKFMD